MLSRSLCLVALGISLIVGTIGCVPVPRSYTEQQVTGEYHIQYPFGADTLMLRADHTYEQRFTDTSGTTYENTGQWRFERRRDNQVDLLDAVNVCDGFGRFASTEPRPGHSFRTVAWYSGVVISVNEDAGFYMRKVR